MLGTWGMSSMSRIMVMPGNACSNGGVCTHNTCVECRRRRI